MLVSLWVGVGWVALGLLWLLVLIGDWFAWFAVLLFALMVWIVCLLVCLPYVFTGFLSLVFGVWWVLACVLPSGCYDVIVMIFVIRFLWMRILLL